MEHITSRGQFGPQRSNPVGPTSVKPRSSAIRGGASVILPAPTHVGARSNPERWGWRRIVACTCCRACYSIRRRTNTASNMVCRETPPTFSNNGPGTEVFLSTLEKKCSALQDSLVARKVVGATPRPMSSPGAATLGFGAEDKWRPEGQHQLPCAALSLGRAFTP